MKVIQAVGFFLFAYGSVCGASDVRYYRLHPKALQEAIAACPAKNPSDVSCDQLKIAALRVNDLAYELRTGPQAYGKKILSLQEFIAKQPTTSTVERGELEDRLAIVKWLESPEGN